MSSSVLCSAPFNSLLVETDKTVKPCCSWSGNVGNLNVQTMEEIRQGPVLKKAQTMMLNNEWPSECMGCKFREDETGTSVRKYVYEPIKAQTDGRLIYFEYNGTNTCNLACAMCGPKWSSSWVQKARKHGLESKETLADSPDWQIRPMNPAKATEIFLSTDFTHLQYLWLKGGEPFLNQESLLLLEHLDRLGVLQKIRVTVTTNGTVSNPKMLGLLSKARELGVIVSIDGLGEINQYIRYGFHDPQVSDTKNIKENILKVLELPNLLFVNPGFTVQVYNVFNLEEFQNWWEGEIYSLKPGVVSPGPTFSHIVMYPQQLSPRVLTDSVRLKLADHYQALNKPTHYEALINYLRLDYFGHELHNRFVQYTKKMDLIRLKPITQLVPQLATELVELN
jgi:radical SAM protein with 4Fe4S-binding SPASM domain